MRRTLAYAAMTKGEAQRSIRTFYGVVKDGSTRNGKRRCAMRRMGMVFMGVVFLIGLHGHAFSDPGAEGMIKAVVRIRSIIPQEAESAGTLGTQREGNGVVIDAEGMILTVGYLIREAESIEVSVLGEKPISGTFVGYDFNTGLGLLKTDKPLGVAPIELGQSAAV